METLKEYYSVIDSKEFENLSDEAIIDLLPKLTPEDADFPKVILENTAFAIRKSLDIKDDPPNGTVRGLSWRFKGKNTDEQGNETNVYVPDVTILTQQDYEYFEQRFKECGGLFPKTEYGLLVYFGQKTPYSKRNDFKKELADNLMSLAYIYWNKALEGGERNYNFQTYFPILRTAYVIYQGARLTAEVDALSQEIIDNHKNWDIRRKDTLRGILDFSNIMAEHFSIFKTKVNFEDVIAKNLAAAKEIEKTYTWGAIYIVDNCILIRQKQNVDCKDLLKYKAELYEKMASERSENFICLQFIDTALRIYQSLKDDAKISELETVYATTREKIEMNSEKFFEFPNDYVEGRSQMIKDLIDVADEQSIIANVASNWFSSIEAIQEMANNASKASLLATMATTNILDKFGNTIDKYCTEEEIKEMHFWQSFGFSFQIGIASLHEYIIEAYKAGKFTYKNLISYLETTWYNEPITHTYHGETIDLRVLDVLKPGLKKCFKELDFSFLDLENNHYDCVTVTDTLTLKMETILRFICEKLGIATFKTRDKGGEKLVMEKLLDDMLNDLRDTQQKPTGFQEADRLMLKYILTPKGYNLRNRVAHGLMDLWEYSFMNIVFLLYLIVRLSTYQFTPSAD
ncbi:DUF4209 domain-containing protein [Parabacteroides sp. OttesenSCG-928-K15]|nr:DUF4209 domain-containing protein [Parabacteroides sp. OttesenSCG-928-K15]